jgi:hypothetical protein
MNTDRSLDIKRTYFQIPELYLNGRSMVMDVIQCNSLYIVVKDSNPSSLTFLFNIRENPTLVGGATELRNFITDLDNFSKLYLTDDYVINRTIGFFEKNPSWRKYPRSLRFSFERTGLIKDFSIVVSRRNSRLIFERNLLSGE